MTCEERALALLGNGSADRDADGWQALAEQAIRDGLGPLLLDHLSESAPDEVIARLRQTAMAATARACRAQHQLQTLLSAADEAGLRVAVLKGPCLANAAYGKPSYRTHGDLDLLSPTADMPVAMAICDRLGYIGSESSEADSHHAPGRAKPGLLPVEWHWRPCALGYAPGLDADELEALWTRMRPLPEVAPSALRLGAEDMVLTLTAHWALSNRCAGGPRALLDIAVACRRWADEIDWDALWQRADRWRMRRALGLALALSGDLLGAPVPAVSEAEVPAAQRQRVTLRIRGEASVQPTGRLADALAGGWGSLARLGLRRALAAPGKRGWLAHWRRMWRHGSGLLPRRGSGDEMAAELDLAAWLSER